MEAKRLILPLGILLFNQCVTNPNFLNASLVGCIDYEMEGGSRCGWSGLLPPKRVTVSLGGNQSNTWIRDRVKALISSDNATF